jgi:predicted nucleic acid-binding protein
VQEVQVGAGGCQGNPSRNRAVRERHYAVGKPNVVKADPDDDKIVECAVAARSDYIVTGDKHLLMLGSYRGTRIAKAAEFLALYPGR